MRIQYTRFLPGDGNVWLDPCETHIPHQSRNLENHASLSQCCSQLLLNSSHYANIVHCDDPSPYCCWRSSAPRCLVRFSVRTHRPIFPRAAAETGHIIARCRQSAMRQVDSISGKPPDARCIRDLYFLSPTCCLKRYLGPLPRRTDRSSSRGMFHRSITSVS